MDPLTGLTPGPDPIMQPGWGMPAAPTRPPAPDAPPSPNPMTAISNGGRDPAVSPGMLGTPDNPATTMSTGQMARETAGLLGQAVTPGLGWGSIVGTALGAAIPGAGLFGMGFDAARNTSAAFGRSPMGQSKFDQEGHAISGPMGGLADKAAAIDAWGGPGGLGGGSVGKSGDSLGGDYSNGNYGGGMDKGNGPAGPGDSGDKGGTGANDPHYDAGGTVQPPMPGAADPPGPDDQTASVQTGEGVLTAEANHRWPGLVDAANAGNIEGVLMALAAGLRGNGGQPWQAGSTI